MEMNNNEIGTSPPLSPADDDKSFEITLHRAPIIWDLENGCFTFFGLDSALFWTDPSLVHTLLPLAEEIGFDLFRLLVAFSSSLGTEEDYHAMVSTLADNFLDGFFSVGKSRFRGRLGRFRGAGI